MTRYFLTGCVLRICDLTFVLRRDLDERTRVWCGGVDGMTSREVDKLVAPRNRARVDAFRYARHSRTTHFGETFFVSIDGLQVVCLYPTLSRLVVCVGGRSLHVGLQEVRSSSIWRMKIQWSICTNKRTRTACLLPRTEMLNLNSSTLCRKAGRCEMLRAT